jgi:MSHA biogenesis protein MshP
MFPKANIRQRGFSIVAAIFLVVVLSALGAALVTVSGLQHIESAMDIQGVRAYQAARAGVEWGLYRALDPDRLVVPTPAPPACWAASPTVTLGGTLAAFVTTVTCSEVNSPTNELGKNIRVYLITSTAKLGAAGTSNYVERQLAVTVSRCSDPSNPPNYDC